MRIGAVVGLVVTALSAACGGRTLSDDPGVGGASGASTGGASGTVSAGGASGAGAVAGGGSGGSVAVGGAAGVGGGVSVGGASGTVGTGGAGGFPPSRCDALCGTPTPPGCPLVLPPDERAQCRRDCEEMSRTVPPECAHLWEELASCVEKSLASCISPEQCEPLADELSACGGGGTCGQGVGWASSEGTGEVQYGACGCRDPGGTAPGGGCNDARECAEVCCGCQGPQEFGVRMCRRGRCAGARACDLAREMVPDVCF